MQPRYSGETSREPGYRLAGSNLWSRLSFIWEDRSLCRFLGIAMPFQEDYLLPLGMNLLLKGLDFRLKFGNQLFVSEFPGQQLLKHNRL